LKKSFGFYFRIPLHDELNAQKFLKKDIEFLQLSKVMDYSLLIGIEELHKGQQVVSTNRSILSGDSKYVYHMGIIDYLSTFRMKKQLEVIAK
jgi:hypothetical protein